MIPGVFLIKKTQQKFFAWLLCGEGRFEGFFFFFFVLCILMSNKSFWFFGFTTTLSQSAYLAGSWACFISGALIDSGGC